MFKLQTLTKFVRKKRQTPDGKVITLTTKDKVRTAVRLMIKYNFSQLPVLNEQSGEVDGVINTDSIVRSLYHLTDPSVQDRAVIDVMELSVAQCIEEAPIHPGESDMLARFVACAACHAWLVCHVELCTKFHFSCPSRSSW